MSLRSVSYCPENAQDESSPCLPLTHSHTTVSAGEEYGGYISLCNKQEIRVRFSRSQRCHKKAHITIISLCSSSPPHSFSPPLLTLSLLFPCLWLDLFSTTLFFSHTPELQAILYTSDILWHPSTGSVFSGNNKSRFWNSADVTQVT